ncbi:MAG: hypothetical protein IKY91_00910, partial [Akkermansia sp.]|nr:hypothetical protein [Akkermansia sp.]
AHEIPPDGGTKAARCAAYSAFTGVKAELDKSRFVEDRLIMPMHHLLRGAANPKQTRCNFYWGKKA